MASSGKYKEAASELQTSRKILEGTLGPQSPHLATVYEALAKVYEKLGEKPEAMAFTAKAMKIKNPEKMQKPQNN
jgi:tetratricopeptide (TPR) repeat protein